MLSSSQLSFYLKYVERIFNEKQTLRITEPDSELASGDDINNCLSNLIGKSADIISPNITSVGNIFNKDIEIAATGVRTIMANLTNLVSSMAPQVRVVCLQKSNQLFRRFKSRSS